MAKPGRKTTEFWLTVAGATLTTAAGVVGALPMAFAAPIAAGLIGIYNVGRVVIKAKEKLDKQP